MTLFGSCGHEIKDDEQEFVIRTKDMTIDYDAEKFVNCVRQSVVCLDCYKFYRRDNLILETEEDERKWMYETP